MKNHVYVAVIAAIAGAFLSQCTFAGQLSPPGPPTSGTMKPLSEIEPRIPIRQADIPLTISTSGSYYLVENITASQNAINVFADDVTIDLQGFTIKGSDSVGSCGFNMFGRRNVEIRNGTIRDFSTALSDTSTGCQDLSFVNLRVISNLANGIVATGSNVLVEKCTLSQNGSTSASSQYAIRVGAGATVVGNRVYSNFNSATGMTFGISAGENSRITANTVYKNGAAALAAFGIEAREGSAVSENTIYNIGEHATTLVRGIAAFNGCTVVGNTVSRNGTYSVDVWGIFTDSGCTIVRNTSFCNGVSASGMGNGIAMGEHCMVDQNTAYNNIAPNLLFRTECTYGTNHAQ